MATQKKTVKKTANKEIVKTSENLPDKAQLKSEIETFMLGSTLTGKLTDTQKKLCLATAMSFGLSPIKREIHFVPYGNGKGGYDLSIVVGYEVYLKRAEKSGKLKGWAIEFIKDGNQSACKITINRSDWAQPFTNTVYEAEVSQPYSSLWKKAPKFMLKKVTISQSFRWVFPEEVGGLPYTPEELGIGAAEGGQLQTEKAPAVIAAPEKASDPQKAKLAILLKEKGYTKEDLYKKYKVGSLSDLTKYQASGIIENLMKLPTKQELPVVAAVPEKIETEEQADQLIKDGQGTKIGLESADKIEGVTQTKPKLITCYCGCGRQFTEEQAHNGYYFSKECNEKYIAANFPNRVKKTFDVKEKSKELLKKVEKTNKV